MEVQLIKLNKIKVNDKNPRTITEDKLRRLIESILVFPKMLSIRPIVVDDKGVALGGNMRTRALKEIKKLGRDAIPERLQQIRQYANKPQEEKNELLAHWDAWFKEQTVPVIYAETLTDEEKREFIIKDNSSFGAWDWDVLANEWESEQLEDWGVDVWTADDNGNDAREIKVQEDDFDADDEQPSIVKRGEVWQLGNHRLMCGDSTSAEDVARLMNGEMADLVFTDPPYGMKKESEGVLNDNLNFDDLLEFNKRWIPLTFANLKDNGSWYCWGIDEPLMDIYSNILRPMQKRNEITFRNLITWDKKHGQGQNSEGFRMYPIADEKCLFVMTGVQDFSTNADNYFEKWEPIRIYLKEQRDAMKWSNGDMKRMVGHSETSGCHWFDKSQWMFPTEEEYRTWQKYAEGKAFTRPYEDIRKEFDAIKAEEDKRRHEWQSTRAYFDNTHDNMTDVWEFGRTRGEERAECGGHATPKPLALCARGIKTSSREGEIVLDVFGGSGSTMIACEQLGRKCRMMELDAHYCDVIIARWEMLTGEQAVKIG